MAFISVNAIKLYYEEHGSGDPVVFIGGLAADHLVWANIIDEYARYFRVIIFDNRGVGQSEAPDYPYTIEMMAKDTLGLMNALDIDKAHMVGSSMGSAVAQYLGCHYPNRTQSLALTVPFTHLSPVFLRFVMLREAMFSLSIPIEVHAGLILPWVFSQHFLASDENWQALIDLRAKNPYPQTEIGYRGQLAALKGFDSRAWISKITVPVLVISGDEDIICLSKDCHKMVAQIPQVQHVVIQDAGHLPHFEQPEAFHQALKPFLKQYSQAIA